MKRQILRASLIMVLWWLYLNQPQCQTFPFFHIIFAWLNSSSPLAAAFFTVAYTYIYFALTEWVRERDEEHENILIYIRQRRRRRHRTKSHFSIYPHFTQCNIYRHVYHYTTSFGERERVRKIARTACRRLTYKIIKPENCGSMKREKGFCASFITHTQSTSHTINLMEWSFSSFHH